MAVLNLSWDIIVVAKYGLHNLIKNLKFQTRTRYIHPARAISSETSSISTTYPSTATRTLKALRRVEFFQAHQSGEVARGNNKEMKFILERCTRFMLF